MNISSKFVGTSLKEYQTDISWRHTMNYAAAVGDDNFYYLDDERDGGVLAPPMFCTAVTWPIFERIWEYIDTDDFPAEIMPSVVHYTEHLAFYRALIPGDSLTLRGEIAAVLPHRAGTLMVTRIDAFDKKRKPVFTEHNGGLFRGVQCIDKGRGKEALPHIPNWKDDDGLFWRSEIHINKLQSFIYDGCTNIVFPIHTSKQFAHQVGLPDIILQGTAILAFAVRELINKEAAMNPERLRALSCRFTGMVFPGTNIRVELVGKDLKEQHKDLFFTVTNQEGRKAISEGFASLKND